MVKPPDDLAFLPSINTDMDLSKKDDTPNYHGIPWEGESPTMKDSDPDPFVSIKTYAAVFYLDKPEHLAYYNAVWQLAGNGVVVISKELFEHDEDKKNWHIFLRWGVQSAHN